MSNTNPKYIHETVLKDIMDIWTGLKNFKEDDFKLLKGHSHPLQGRSSIAKASSNLNLVFPVICSRGIAIENASMVSKAIEKNAVTMLQRLFASFQIADPDIKSVEDYVKTFHSNLSSGAMSLDDLFELSESSEFISARESAIMNKAIKEDMKNINYYLPSSINESSLMAFAIDANGSVSIQRIHEADADKTDKHANALKNLGDWYQKQVADSDFKKANELMPTTMVINFQIRNEEGTTLKYQDGVIGVKAKLYPIGSEDIVKHISEKNTEKNWVTNFLRSCTREISFVKDFVLALDKAKIDALSLSTRKSTSDKMWKVLERRALISRINKSMRKNNSAAAITTLCISQEEVEYMRKNLNIDIERIPTVLGLFTSLNLMCICIVDESLEVAKFIYDEEEPMWETISFTHLERESSDNTYKRVVNLMTKVAR